MDLKTLVQRLLESGDVKAIATNPRAQFGREPKNYLGATLMPEQDKPNEFTERSIRMRSVIANHGDRYSPAQKKGQAGALWQTMEIELGNSDLARDFTGPDYDAMVEYFDNGMDMQAAAAVLGWLDVEINTGLVELNEKERWDAITDALVMRRGDYGYTEPVYYHNPAGHRVNAAAAWSDPSYDPWPDIVNAVQFLQKKGFAVNRIVYSSTIESILLGNPKISQRIGASPLIIAPGGTIQTITTGITLTIDQLANLFRANRMPAPEIYDEFYNTQVGTARFSREDCMYFFCTTGRDVRLMMPPNNNLLIIPNTLGYVGIGRPVGERTNGRDLKMWADNHKPPHLEGEGKQTSLAVLAEPEGVYVLKNIS